MAHLTRIKTSLTIPARRKVAGLLDGQYASTVAGRSLDYSDLREYVVGDDVKDIDWKASARLNSVLVKRYIADRKHTVQLVVAGGAEMSASSQTPGEAKSSVAIMAAGLLGFLATQHSDYVGLSLGVGTDVTWARPSTKETELERMLNQIEAGCQPGQPQAVLDELFGQIISGLKKRTIMILVMCLERFSAAQVSLLGRLSIQHEIFAVVVGDLGLDEARASGQSVMGASDALQVPSFLLADTQLASQLQQSDAAVWAQMQSTFTKLGIPSQLIGSTDQVISAVNSLLARAG
ncbi:DUF58 domain-containing protein [Cutibacterium equinum]|uniref:DUF58 domain-containing protein n=1 Tax=Cutibacterium equinum TaxID=3016342 RepID=A0ABY7R001_9ACTN|nr:DUF58 domain-containing protein [Cutibacterium equinum]WCC79847.1 DUF58 domain-containing protein [Cutibacterium equinum]